MDTNALSLESFNEILFSCLKPGVKRAQLLAAEIDMAYKAKIEAMEALVDCLNNGVAYHDKLQIVNNIDASLDKLARQLEEAEKEEGTPDTTENKL